ncbi:hypothetical protein [Actinomadura monticuli]
MWGRRGGPWKPNEPDGPLLDGDVDVALVRLPVDSDRLDCRPAR